MTLCATAPSSFLVSSFACLPVLSPDVRLSLSLLSPTVSLLDYFVYRFLFSFSSVPYIISIMSDSTSSSRDLIPKLNETNFLEWKENMMGLLMAKKLWKYVQKDHSTDDEQDQQAKGFIWISIEHQQRAHVPAGASAHQTWKALCTKHELVGPQVISNCIFGIIAIRYVEGTKMEDHLAKLKEYFTRLDAVDCKLPETVKAVFVLASLPSTWTVFKQTQTAAASIIHPLTVTNVCLAILQERCNEAWPRFLTDTSLMPVIYVE